MIDPRLVGADRVLPVLRERYGETVHDANLDGRSDRVFTAPVGVRGLPCPYWSPAL